MSRHRLNPDCFNPWVYEHLNDYTKRMEVYYGGAGSGKSYGAMQKILLKALNHKRKVLVVRKVARTLYHSVFSLLTDLLMESGFYRYADINRSRGYISICNGSEFLFKGIDDPEKIKSINAITDIVVEEATELTLEDFTQLNLRLRSLEEWPQIYLMFNPVSKSNWVYRYFFEQTPPDCRLVRSSYRDNRFLPEAYVRQLQELERSNPAYYRIYTLGEFATLDKLVYPVVEKRLISQEEVQGLPFFGGVDFGYVNDPTAMVWGRYDKLQRIIYITGEYFGKGMDNRAIAKTIQALGLAKEVWTADSAEQKSIAEIRELGIPRMKAAKKGGGSVLYGISWIHAHHLVLDERCRELAEEFESYVWKKDKSTGEPVNEPEDSCNHGMDALRYGLENWMQRRGMQVFRWKEAPKT